LRVKACPFGSGCTLVVLGYASGLPLPSLTLV